MGKIGTQAPSVSREAAQLEAAIAAAGLSEEAAHKVLTCGLAAAYVPQRGQSMKPRKRLEQIARSIGLLEPEQPSGYAYRAPAPDPGGV